MLFINIFIITYSSLLVVINLFNLIVLVLVSFLTAWSFKLKSLVVSPFFRIHKNSQLEYHANLYHVCLWFVVSYEFTCVWQLICTHFDIQLLIIHYVTVKFTKAHLFAFGRSPLHCQLKLVNNTRPENRYLLALHRELFL